MPFTPNYSVSQTSALNTLLFTDTSSGTFPAVTARRIYLNKIDNSTLVPSGTTTTYIDWPIISGIGDTLTVNVLQKDYSLNIVVNWISGTTDTKAAVNTFTGYTNLALYQLIQKVSATPSILNDTNFYSNLEKCYTELDNANQAQVYFDQYSSQAALDRAYQLLSHQNLYF